MPGDEISVHIDEFFLLWFAHHRLADLPPFLGISPVGRSRAERAERTAAASASLAARDLGTIQNPAADVRAAVELLAEAPVRIEFGRADSESASWTVAAVRHPHAAVATRTDTEVRLRTCDAAGVVPNLIENLPAGAAGMGTSVNVPAADFQHAREAAAAAGTRAFREVLDDAGVHPRDMPTFAQAVGDSSSDGVVAAARRDETGAWRHAPLRISWRDTASGRYLIQQDGAWVTVTPADMARLSSMTCRVVDQLT